MVGPGNAHILGRFPLTGSRLLCHILVLLHKRYKITQNLPLVHKTGEGTCLTKEAVGTCGVQVKSHWSIPFPFLGLYVHGPYDVNILDVITFYRPVNSIRYNGLEGWLIFMIEKILEKIVNEMSPYLDQGQI